MQRAISNSVKGLIILIAGICAIGALGSENTGLVLLIVALTAVVLMAQLGSAVSQRRKKALLSWSLIGLLAWWGWDSLPSLEDAKATYAKETAKAQNQPAKKPEVAASKSPTRTDLLNDPTKQAVWIEVSKDAVRSRLKDPSSAKFRKVFFHAFQNTTPVVCGEVNGKNSFGGYHGYQGFIASGETLVYLESDFQAFEFNKAWNELCLR